MTSIPASLPPELAKRIEEMAKQAHTKWIMFLNPENGNSDCLDTPSEVFVEAYTKGATDIAKELLAENEKIRETNQRMWIVCSQLDRWRNAWASQDTSDAEPARKAMFKALDYLLGYTEINPVQSQLSAKDAENEKLKAEVAELKWLLHEYESLGKGYF